MRYFETPNGYVNNQELQIKLFDYAKPKNNKNPLDWRHKNFDLLTPIGKDIFINNLAYTEIAKKYEISERTVSNLAARLKPKNMERVYAGQNKLEWKKKASMKVKLELELEDRAWSASEIILALSRTLQKLNGAPGSGPVLDAKDLTIDRWEEETLVSQEASK